jgi:hypothetical protein
VAAPAPTADYGIDVHINTGVLGLNLDTITQDVLVTPLWMALIWAVHALIVMLEWSFTIDLLDSPAAGTVGSGLREMQRTITDPWLACVLAVASVITLYNGLIRRRIAESVGQALLTLVMMIAGTWVMLDPTATVGALGAWANQAGVGTLGVTASGSPAGAGRTLADSMSSLFDAAVEAPWCYLEFGNVGWCRDRTRLDPQLREAALKLAARELAQIGCKPIANPFGPGPECVARGSGQAAAVERSARMLRAAQSNGGIFLALPANGPARNSINNSESLLRALCQSSEATACRGPTAAEAEFRDGGGTWSRVGGLVLIVGGALGLLLLFGFIALRLLGAAIFSLLYLLLAPAAVLAPALGDGGRELFRRWATRLLGAVVSKLIYSFALGVLLAVVAILTQLGALGWWTQWLLMSALWWGAYTHRHQALALAGARVTREQGSGPRSIARQVKSLATSPLAAVRGVRAAREVLAGGRDAVAARRQRAQASVRRAGERADEQVKSSLVADFQEASARVADAPRIQAAISEKRARLGRLELERERATGSGDDRRAAKLAHRAVRLEGEIGREQEALSGARRTVEQGERGRRATGKPYTLEQREARERFLDAQAAIAPGIAGRSAQERRDYAALAGLLGMGREQYERLDPHGQREARAGVDRELAMRTRLSGAAADLMDASASLGWRQQRKADREFDRALTHRMRESGYEPRPTQGRPVGAPRGADARPGVNESSVMRDAREVAARRKRQLGRGRR